MLKRRAALIIGLAAVAVTAAAVLVRAERRTAGDPVATTPALDRSSSRSSGWQPLFNGRGLDGWRQLGGGKVSVQDGLLLLENDDQRQPGYLVSSVAARDFIAHVRCRVIEGDSGLFYRGRVDPRTPTTIQGPQVQLNVTPDRSLGGLFETQGRGWLCRVPLEQNARLLHGLDWIECTIEARGPHIQVTVNGEVTADFHDNPDANPFAGRGFFALQIHGGGFCRVLFEDIRVLVMDV